jgi:hypothetical protein
MGMGVEEESDPVAMEVAVATPRDGVSRAGDVFKTTGPVPVQVVVPVPPELMAIGVEENREPVEIEVAVAAPREGLVRVGD